MSAKDRTVAAVLRALAKFVDNLSDEEYEALMAGTLKLSHPRPKSDARNPRKIARFSTEEAFVIANKLKSAQSKAEARSTIENEGRFSLKDNLLAVAKALNAHVNKHDKRDALIEKLIAVAVGARVRSEAIQGVNLKGSAPASDSASS